MIFMHGPKIIARACLLEDCEILKTPVLKNICEWMPIKQIKVLSCKGIHPKKKFSWYFWINERSNVCKNDVSISNKWYIDFMFRENVWFIKKSKPIRKTLILYILGLNYKLKHIQHWNTFGKILMCSEC